MFTIPATLPFRDPPQPLGWRQFMLYLLLGDIFSLIKIHSIEVSAEGWKLQPPYSSVEGCLVMCAQAEVLRGSPKMAGTGGGEN